MDSKAKYFFLGILFTLFIFAAGFGVYKLERSQVTPSLSPAVPQPALSTEGNTQPAIGQVNIQKKTQAPTVTFDNSGGISDVDKNLPLAH